MRNELVPRQVPIVGPPHLVRATLATQHRQGLLVTDPRRVILRRNADGTVVADVTLLVAQPPWWRRRTPVLLAGAGLVLLAAAGWLLVRAVVHAVASIDGPAAFGGLVIAGGLLLAVLANRSNHRGACPGVAVHCRGCRR